MEVVDRLVFQERLRLEKGKLVIKLQRRFSPSLLALTISTDSSPFSFYLFDSM
jgi:hypothetical protein